MNPLFNKAVKIGMTFQKRKKIIKAYSKEDLIKIVKQPLLIKGQSMKQILKEFEKDYLPFCVNQASPNYLAFPDSGNAPEAIAADILKTFLNQNLISDCKSAPIGTYMEIQVINWFRQLIGYKKDNIFPLSIQDVGGVVCFGGVMSINTCLLVARSKLKENSFKNGFFEKKTYLLVPDVIDHYSKELSLGYLGIGTKNLVRVQIDKNFKMDIEDLRRKIAKIKSKRGKILAVVAYAGDSRFMRIDNLKEIAATCKSEKIWFHVDACHGGALLFSDKLRIKLDGIEQADSITLDPHKILGVPYPCSLALFKRAKDLILVSKSYDTVIQKGTYDLGQITPFIGSKSFESLKLWFLLKSKGKLKIGKEVEKRFRLANYFKQILDKDGDFLTLNDVNINSVAFIYFPSKLRKLLSNPKNKNKTISFLDNLNRNIHDNLYQKGDVCIHTFKLVDAGNRAQLKKYGKRQVLGVILGNPLITEKNLKSNFNIIKKESSKVYSKMKGRLK